MCKEKWARLDDLRSLVGAAKTALVAALEDGQREGKVPGGRMSETIDEQLKDIERISRSINAATARKTIWRISYAARQ